MIPTPRHTAFYDALKSALNEHLDIPADELLSISAQFTGGIMALLPCVTPIQSAVIGSILSENLKIGHQATTLASATPEGSA